MGGILGGGGGGSSNTATTTTTKNETNVGVEVNVPLDKIANSMDLKTDLEREIYMAQRGWTETQMQEFERTKDRDFNYSSEIQKLNIEEKNQKLKMNKTMLYLSLASFAFLVLSK